MTLTFIYWNIHQNIRLLQGRMILVPALSISLNPLLVAAENHHLTPSRMKAHMLQQLDLACMHEQRRRAGMADQKQHTGWRRHLWWTRDTDAVNPQSRDDAHLTNGRTWTSVTQTQRPRARHRETTNPSKNTVRGQQQRRKTETVSLLHEHWLQLQQVKCLSGNKPSDNRLINAQTADQQKCNTCRQQTEMFQAKSVNRYWTKLLSEKEMRNLPSQKATPFSAVHEASPQGFGSHGPTCP